MIARDDTTDPRLESWISIAPESDFPIQNLPFGVFLRDGGARIGVAIGDQILDLSAAATAGFLGDIVEPELLQAPVLNPLLAAGSGAWRALRERLSALLRIGGDPGLRDGNLEKLLCRQDDV